MVITNSMTERREKIMIGIFLQCEKKVGIAQRVPSVTPEVLAHALTTTTVM